MKLLYAMLLQIVCFIGFLLGMVGGLLLDAILVTSGLLLNVISSIVLMLYASNLIGKSEEEGGV